MASLLEYTTTLGAEAAGRLQNGANTLFNLTSIDSNNPNLDQSKYNFSQRVFPEDLGTQHSQHYMINVNVPVSSAGVDRSSYSNSSGIGGTFRSSILNNEYSKVDNLRFNRNSNIVQGAGAAAEASERYAPTRSTRRIAESIALYIPAPMIYTGMNSYEEISLTSILGKVATLAAQPGARALGAFAGAASGSVRRGQRGSEIGGNVVGAVGRTLGTAAALAGSPINPRIEVLFSNTIQRQFAFEFLLAPRSEKESLTIKEIIRTLRYHHAPEIETIAGIIPTFIPPAEFDITFYQNGTENLTIPRINTCVLERVEVDYTPTGIWSTFSNGYPVATRLSLAFREIEIVHKRRVIQGF